VATPPTPPHSIDDFVQGYEAGRTLRGFRCTGCGTLTATWGLACSRCGSSTREEVTLTTRGRIVAGTIVTVASGEFVNDAPYAYVVVELEAGGRLSGWMPHVASEAEIVPGTKVRFAPGYKAGVQFERAEADGAEAGSR